MFVTLFDAKHLLAPLLWNMFYKEVEVSDCMQTLFRGNSLASKVRPKLQLQGDLELIRNRSKTQ